MAIAQKPPKPPPKPLPEHLNFADGRMVLTRAGLEAENERLRADLAQQDQNFHTMAEWFVDMAHQRNEARAELRCHQEQIKGHVIRKCDDERAALRDLQTALQTCQWVYEQLQTIHMDCRWSRPTRRVIGEMRERLWRVLKPLEGDDDDA